MARPNVLLILNDDMGYSDIGCYGGEVETPSLDRLAARGLRYTQFYNTARCCPSRASLLTGLHPHQADVGNMMGDDGIDGYLGDLSRKAVTIAEVLGAAGYATYMSGKWHVTRHVGPDASSHNWPCNRGFDRYFGYLGGATDYFQPHHLVRDMAFGPTPDDPEFYLTDAISDAAAGFVREHAAANADQPFFLYTAYTSPHWPLHAKEEDAARYKGRFAAGWDKLREERRERMIAMGLLDPAWPLSERDPAVPPWEEATDKEWQQRRMEVYAAQIDRMDQGIGRIVQALEETGQLENTLILFLADNGGCAEDLPPEASWVQSCAQPTTRDGKPCRAGNSPEIWPGGPETYCSYGIEWANLSDTPYRKYKHWIHEGGISTPLIVHWPAGIAAQGELRHQPGQLPDIMATLLEVTGADYPAEYAGEAIKPCEGFSMAPTFSGGEAQREWFFWEHHGNCGVRRGQWKLVCEYPQPWELYDLQADRTETRDLAAEQPERVAEMLAAYHAWAERCNVKPYDYFVKRRG